MHFCSSSSSVQNMSAWCSRVSYRILKYGGVGGIGHAECVPGQGNPRKCVLIMWSYVNSGGFWGCL